MKITRWDPVEHIKSEYDEIMYLDAAFEDGDPAVIQAVLGDIARARGMTGVAKESGIGRESLYKSLNRGGRPSFATVMKIVKTLGFSIRVEHEKACEKTA